jgi:hypothetical protein
MGFKRAILEIGTYNYHGQPWDIGLVHKFLFHIFYHIFYCLIVNLNYQFKSNVMKWWCNEMVDMNVWLQACEQWVVLFPHVMPMCMDNLIIV